MSHTHLYFKYGSQESLTVLKSVSVGECPSHHPGCMASGTEFEDYIGFVDLSEQETSASLNTTGHTHTYLMPRVDSYVTGIADAGGSTNPAVVCDPIPLRCKASNKSDNYASAVTIETRTTGPAVYEGDTHYHTYTLTDYSPIRGILGFTTCSLGHAGCQMNATGNRYIPLYGSEYSLDTSNAVTGAAVETDDIEHTDMTWVLASILVTVNGLSLYCGVRWWRDTTYKSINWHSPPGGSTVITEDGECKINIGGLSPGVTYTWQAYALDTDSEEYTGDEKQFTMPTEPSQIFGTGEGYDYWTARKSAEHIANLAAGRVFIDKNGNINYQSRLTR